MRAAKVYANTCDLCGRAYETKSPIRRYCSNACRVKRGAIARGAVGIATVTRVCTVCGEGFSPRTMNQLTCGSECRRRHEQDRDRINKAAWYQARKRQEQDALARRMRQETAIRRGDLEVEVLPPTHLACHGCARFAPCADSETGGQCVAGVFRSCQPWTVAPKFYQAREARA